MDWLKLITFEGSQNKAFEELCAWLFLKEYGANGDPRRVRPPDKGVEAYIIQPDNSIIGIQTKFFNSGTIDWTQIKRSLLTALMEWPDLKEWRLAIHLNPTAEEWTNKWDNLKKELSRNVKGSSASGWNPSRIWKSRVNSFQDTIDRKLDQVKLTHWTGSDIGKLLAKPEHVGFRLVFFGELECDINWFKDSINTKLHTLSSKYLPDLHVEGRSDEMIQYLINSKVLSKQISHLIQEIPNLEKAVRSLIEDLRDIAKIKRNCDFYKKIQGQVDLSLKRLSAFSNQAKMFIIYLKDNKLEHARKIKFEQTFMESRLGCTRGDTLWELLENIRYDHEAVVDPKAKVEIELVYSLRSDKPFEVCYNSTEKTLKLKLNHYVDVTSAERIQKEIVDKVPNFGGITTAILQELLKEFQEYTKERKQLLEKTQELEDELSKLAHIHTDVILMIEIFSRQKLFVLSDPGIGKTHLVCKSCEKQIRDNKPAILLLGSQFKSKDCLKEQIRQHLGFAPKFGWSDILSALETAAQIYGGRLLFAIDALNESPVWDLVISGEIQEIIENLIKSPWIAVVLTSRQSYAKPLFGTATGDGFCYLRNNESIQEYRKTYFDYYKVRFKSVPPGVRRHLEDRFFVTLISKMFCLN